MDSTEANKPPARPKIGESGKIALGVGCFIFSMSVLSTIIVSMLMNAHDVSAELAADPNATFTPKTSPYNGSVLLACTWAGIVAAVFLLISGASNHNKAMASYASSLESQLETERSERAVVEARLASIEAETLSYRVERRAAQLRGDDKLITRLVEEEFGPQPGTATPPEDSAS